MQGSNNSPKPQARIFLTSGAVVLVRLALWAVMIYSLVYILLRAIIASDSWMEYSDAIQFVLLSRYSIMTLLCIPALFFLSFFRKRIYRRFSKKTSLWLARGEFLLIVLIVLNSGMQLHKVVENATDTKDQGPDALPGLEIIAPKSSEFTRQATETRPAYKAKTNTYGFRDRELSGRLPEGLRIMQVGDSFVFGSGVEQADTINRRLEEELLRLDAGRRYRVYNISQPGWNLEQEVSAIIEMGRILKPDLVLLSHLPGNDIWPKDPMFRWKKINPELRDWLLQIRARQIERHRNHEYENEKLVADYREQIKRLLAWADESGTDVLVYTYGICIPEMELWKRSPRIFIRYFIEWSLIPENVITGDGHPTARGNLHLANLLATHVSELDQRRKLEQGTVDPVARKRLAASWPQKCGPLGEPEYSKRWVIPGEKSGLVKDMVLQDWLAQVRWQYNGAQTKGGDITFSFMDENGKKIEATLRKESDSPDCRPCGVGYLCMKQSAQREKLSLMLCQRVPDDLWRQIKEPSRK